MNVEQAIFTSIRSQQLDGYQLAATSPGITKDEANELGVWGPAHDALVCDSVRATSVNFHRLKSGRFGVSRTNVAGEEYSGRGGGQVYTHILVVEEETLARFGYHPFRVLGAAEAGGHVTRWEDVDDGLESFPLPGMSSPAHGMEVARAKHTLSIWVLARLVHIGMLDTHVGVISDQNPLLQMAATFDLLPLNARQHLTFSTGLKPSSQREFRLMVVHTDDDAHDVSLMDRGRVWFDLRAEADDPVETLGEWAQFVATLLEGGHAAALPRLLRTADHQRDGSLTEIISELQVGIARNVEFVPTEAPVAVS